MDEEEIETWYAEESNKRFEQYKQIIIDLGEKKAYEWYRTELVKIREKYLALYLELIYGKKKEPLKEKVARIEGQVMKKISGQLKKAEDYAEQLRQKNPEKEIFNAQRQSALELKQLRRYIWYRNFILKHKLDYPMYVAKHFFVSSYSGIANWFSDMKKWFGEMAEKTINRMKDLLVKTAVKFKAGFDRLMKIAGAVHAFFGKVFGALKERLYKLGRLFKKKKEVQAANQQQPQQATQNPAALATTHASPTNQAAQEKKGGEQMMEENKKEGVFSKLLSIFKAKKLEPAAQAKPQAPLQASPQTQEPAKQLQQAAQPQPAIQQQTSQPSPQSQKMPEAEQPALQEGKAKKKSPAKKSKKAPSKRKK